MPGPRRFKMVLKLKETEEDFGMGVGVIASQVVDYAEAPSAGEPRFAMFMAELGELQENFKDRFIWVDLNELEEGEVG